MYTIYRKHSSDTNYSLVTHAPSKAWAKRFIAKEIAYLEQEISTPSKVGRLGDYSSIKFSGIGAEWSICYWFVKLEATNG